MSERKNIVIISKDEITWSKFGCREFPFLHTELVDAWSDMVEYCETVPDVDNTYVELVDSEYFAEFNKPYC